MRGGEFPFGLGRQAPLRERTIGLRFVPAHVHDGLIVRERLEPIETPL